MRKSVLAIIVIITAFLSSCSSSQGLRTALDKYWQESYTGEYGIQVNEVPQMLLAGEPLYITGLNCYNLFVQCHEADALATSQMEQTVDILVREQVPIVRFSVLPFYPNQVQQFLQHKEQYYSNLELLATLCDQKHILLIPAFFWHSYGLPEVYDEDATALGTKGTKTFTLIEEITKEIVDVLKDHKCIAMWEFGNESNLQTDVQIGNNPRFTVQHLNNLLTAFGEICRDNDPYHRLIGTGHGMIRNAQWHLAYNDNWDCDSFDQYCEILGTMTPEPIKASCEHIYEENRYLADFGPQTKLQTYLKAKEAAARNGKVFYLGEFTGICDDILRVKDSYECVVAAEVQLSLQWNYALKGDIEYSFSADTEQGKDAFALMRFYNEKLAQITLSESEKAAKNKLTVASIFSDHAVLQRNSKLAIWGWAKPNTKVSVHCSWGEISTTKSAANGSWKTYISTPEAGGPHRINIMAQGEEIELNDILTGEVWLCSGQSNMGMNIGGFAAQVPEGALDDVLQANEYEDRIRVYNIRDRRQFAPQDTLSTRWSHSDPINTSVTTAIGYKFAKRLTRLLGVPVGIIDNSWGGSTIEPWISEENFTSNIKNLIAPESYATSVGRVERSKNAPWQIGTMFNTRMKPIAGYGIAGFLWYQGCGNRGGYDCYSIMQSEMVREWREAWGDTENALPFYFTTIAPFYYWGPDRVPTSGYFVENQLSSLDCIPNSGAAITQTLGEKGNIHPWKKQEIADQFVLMAAADVYGIATGLSRGFPYPDDVLFPANSSVEEGVVHQSGFSISLRKSDLRDNTIVVHFANAPIGMMHHNEFKDPVIGFEVAGPDRIFRPVEAGCLNNCVYLDCTGIANPVAVRYAFYNYADCNLVSSIGVPVPAFRTDNWPER